MPAEHTCPPQSLLRPCKHPGLAAGHLERKLVAGRRGGYRFEHNLLLASALEHMGLEVDPIPFGPAGVCEQSGWSSPSASNAGIRPLRNRKIADSPGQVQPRVNGADSWSRRNPVACRAGDGPL